MTRRRIFILLGTIVLTVIGIPLLLVLGPVIWINIPFTSGVVVHKTFQDGIEAFIVQIFKGSLVEPYQVSLYVKYPETDWQWYYLSHEADRWRDVDIEIKDSTIKIHRQQKLEVSISLEEKDFVDGNPNSLPGEWSVRKITNEHNSAHQQ